MKQNWQAVAGALVENERVRISMEQEPPLTRLTADGIARTYGLDWGRVGGGPRAQRYLRVALGNAYRGGLLARLQDKRTGNFVREDQQIVYVDPFVMNWYVSFGPMTIPHRFGEERYEPPKNPQPMDDDEREGWAKYAAAFNIVLPEHWHVTA